MLPRLTYIIKAFENIDKLESTIQSISGLNQKTNLYIAILAKESDFDKIKDVLDQNQGVPESAPKIFNKFPFGTPSFALCFGDGKIRESDVIKAAVNNTKFTEIYSVCNSGDTFHINHPLFVIEALKECYKTVGLVYTDFYENGLRRFSFPFMKEAFDLYTVDRYSFPSFVIDKIGNNTEKDFQKNIIEQYMAIQIPHPLLRINNE